ncbi:hypothetical protein OVY01_22540 [Robbsia sp. Bb-Pol-6]|uniref:Ankyrin n=2 Tax=Robbsia betulipollinis TaxID=2981849 RepID=A0ABT3ZTN4_9BURK|nr:hypothetical protein [Robbsia betulipollinis]
MELVDAGEIDLLDLLRGGLHLGIPIQRVKQHDGKTLLHVPQVVSDPDVVGYAPDLYANLNTEDDSSDTPLHIVATDDRYPEETLSLLVDHDADILACNVHGLTPLHVNAITALVEAGCDVKALNRDGLTPRDLARNNVQNFAEIDKIFYNAESIRLAVVAQGVVFDNEAEEKSRARL